MAGGPPTASYDEGFALRADWEAAGIDPDLWAYQFINSRRGPMPPTAQTMIREALDRGYPLTWRDISLISRHDSFAPDLEDPVVVAEFLVALTADRDSLRVLDPWAGVGVSLGALLEAGRISEAVAIEINAEIAALGRDLVRDERLRWITGDAAVQLKQVDQGFDLVIGSPPIGLPKATLRLDKGGVDLRASATYTMLIQAGVTLADEGTMAVVLPESFFGHEQRNVREALEAADLHLAASFTLPAKAYRTVAISRSIMVFERRPSALLFAARIEDPADFPVIVSNYRARRAGRTSELGRLVSLGEFHSWRSLTRADDIQGFARQTGLKLVTMSDVLVAAHRPRSEGEPFDVIDNAVYLPKVGNSPAVTSIDQFSIKPQNYIQLVLDRAKCDAEFVAGFLSSPMGIVLREQLLTGTTIPSVSLQTLRTGHLLLPPKLEQQHNTIALAREIEELRQGAEIVEQELWRRPLAVKDGRAALERLRGGDGFEPWMESLPFPLASILWRYRATDKAKRKCGLLVNFFEATTIFLVDLLMSGLQNDPVALSEIRKHDAAVEVSYGRGSIGVWADLLARAADQTRRLAEGPSDAAMELFQVTDTDRLKAVASRRTVSLLMNEAAKYRRDWIGHTAPVSVAEWERRLQLAERTLDDLRASLRDAFLGWRLARPGAARMRSGIFHTDAEDLTGTRREFRWFNVELRGSVEDGGLYMLEDGAGLMLRLGPLVRFRHAPESVEDACYFYDRIEGKSIRWLSYHFADQATVLEPDEEVVAWIEELDRLG